MPSLPNVSLPTGLWHKMRAFYSGDHSSSRLSTPRTWRLSSAGKRPRPSAVAASTPKRNSTGRTSIFSSYGAASRPPRTSSAARQQLASCTSLSDFELLTVLGRGTFGVVRLARHRDSGRVVAVKILDRDEVVAMKQEVNILREQSVHLALRHAFISDIYATFQDTDAVYFVLEYLPGGEVYSLVYQQEDEELLAQENNNDGETSGHTTDSDAWSDDDAARVAPTPGPGRRSSLSFKEITADNSEIKRALTHPEFGGLHEQHVAFYAACVVSALAYLHDDCNVLYRDLKLENLVIAQDGYPKLIDFGLAKPDAARDRTTTLCGSAEYMAPEVVQRECYDVRADLWSLGVLLFELFFAATPFYHANAREQKRRICEDAVVFPDGFEKQHPEASELMRALLAKNPQDRPVSCASLKHAAFFRQYFPTPQAWRQLDRKQPRAPFVPQLSGPLDTSLFANAYDEDDEDAFAGY
jgi:serine/threonine protein kinase